MSISIKKSVVLVISFFFFNQSVIANSGLNTDDEGLLISGYDPVAYHIVGAATKGSESHQLEYQDIKILFTSEENKQVFVANPEKYIPSYGGFCSYGVRSGKYSDSDPTAFEIVDGRLFLMYNKGTALIWNKNPEDNIKVADKVWPTMSK